MKRAPETLRRMARMLHQRLTSRRETGPRARAGLDIRSLASQRSGLDSVVLTEYPENPFLIAAQDAIIRPAVSASGVWEPGFAPFVGALLPPNARIVLAGGHIGLLGFQLWRTRPDLAHVLIFEPDSVNAGLLALNVMSWRDAPVSTVPVALGARTEILSLARNPLNTGDNRLWETIPPELHAGGGDPQQWARERVVTVALDDVWQGGRLHLLLLDAQGWEPDILRGAARLIEGDRPLVVLEWWPRALVARGIDPEEFLTWLERDLKLRLEPVPPSASGFSNPAICEAVPDEDIRKITELLLRDSDPAAYVELIASPAERSRSRQRRPRLAAPV